MLRSKGFAACFAVGALSAVVMAPQASAKSYKVKLKCQTKSQGQVLSGSCNGKPFGKTKVGGTIVIPKVTLIVKAKGGTATMKYTGSLKGTVVTATWKWVKGTGKYKGIKGGGKAKGTVLGDFTFTGTAKY